MERSIALVNLHRVCVDIVGVAADEGSLSRQSKLHVALSQGQLRLFALSHVDLGSDRSYWLPSFIV